MVSGARQRPSPTCVGFDRTEAGVHLVNGRLEVRLVNPDQWLDDRRLAASGGELVDDPPHLGLHLAVAREIVGNDRLHRYAEQQEQGRHCPTRPILARRAMDDAGPPIAIRKRAEQRGIGGACARQAHELAVFRLEEGMPPATPECAPREVGVGVGKHGAHRGRVLVGDVCKNVEGHVSDAARQAVAFGPEVALGLRPKVVHGADAQGRERHRSAGRQVPQVRRAVQEARPDARALVRRMTPDVPKVGNARRSGHEQAHAATIRVECGRARAV